MLPIIIDTTGVNIPGSFIATCMQCNNQKQYNIILEECWTLWGERRVCGNCVFWKRSRSSGVIIIEDMILKMSVKNLGKNGMRRLIGGLRIQSVPSRRLCPLMESPPVLTDSDLEEL